MTLLASEAKEPNDIDGAFRRDEKERVGGLTVLPDPMYRWVNDKRIADLAVKYRLPAIYGIPEYVEVGGLIAYAANVSTSSGAPLLRGQDSQRRQARRFAGGAADEVRVYRQPQDRKADRPDDSAECAGESGKGNQMRQ